MNWESARPFVTRAAMFAGTLVLSFTVVGFLPSTRARRQNSFARASADGSLNRMRLLRLAGANVNSRSSCCSPLFLAAGEGRLEAVRYLLDQGADINAVEAKGRTAITEAAFYGRSEVIKELVLRGANINAISDQGTALDIALETNQMSVVAVLKHYGARRACDIGGSC